MFDRWDDMRRDDWRRRELKRDRTRTDDRGLGLDLHDMNDTRLSSPSPSPSPARKGSAMTKPAKPVIRVKAGSTPASNGVVCPDCSCANGCVKKAAPADKPKRTRTKKAAAAAVATPVAAAPAVPEAPVAPAPAPFADMPPPSQPQPENAMTDTTKPAPTLVVTDADRERHADLTGKPIAPTADTAAPAATTEAPKADAPTDAAPAPTEAPKADAPTDAAPAAPTEGTKADAPAEAAPAAPTLDAPKAEEPKKTSKLMRLLILSAVVLVVALFVALAWLWLTKPGPVIASDLDTPPAAGAPNLAPLPALPTGPQATAPAAPAPAPVAPAPQVTATAPVVPAPAPVVPAPQATAPAPVVPPVVAAPPAVTDNGITARARASAQGPNARAEAEVTVGPANRAPARTAAPRATFEERPYPSLDPDARVIYNFRDRTVTFVPGSYGYDIGGTGTVTYDSLNSEYKREFDRLCREFRACS